MEKLFAPTPDATRPSIFTVSARSCLPIARVIAGSAFGKRSAVGMQSEWFYAEVVLEPGASAPLDPDYEERAIYLVEGEIEIESNVGRGTTVRILLPLRERRMRLLHAGGEGKPNESARAEASRT